MQSLYVMRETDAKKFVPVDFARHGDHFNKENQSCSIVPIECRELFMLRG